MSNEKLTFEQAVAITFEYNKKANWTAGEDNEGQLVIYTG